MDLVSFTVSVKIRGFKVPTLILCMMVAPLGILIGLITTIDKENHVHSD